MKLYALAAGLILVSTIQGASAVANQVSCYQAAVKLPVITGSRSFDSDEKTLSTDRAIELCAGAKDNKPIDCYREAVKQKYHSGKIRPDREERDMVVNTDRAIQLCSEVK